MSIATDVRSYADAAVEQGKTVLTQASSTLTTANKRIVADAQKPVYAWIGAADLIAESLGKRVEALPSEALANLAKAQETGKARLTKAQQDAFAKVTELRNLLDSGVESAKELGATDLQGKAKDTAEGYLGLAKSLYTSLSARGEDKVAELLKDPRVGKLLTEVADVTESAESRVRPVVESVEARVRPVVDAVEARVRPVADSVDAKVSPVFNSVIGSAKYTAKSVDSALNRSAEVDLAPAVKKATAKAPARKSTAKAPARKAPAKKAPATKAPAKNAAAKAPAKKAAAKASATKASTAATSEPSTSA
jgi:heparin binding hemagglutinin HbhA